MFYGMGIVVVWRGNLRISRYTGDWVMSIPTNTDRMLFLLHYPHHHHRKKKRKTTRENFLNWATVFPLVQKCNLHFSDWLNCFEFIFKREHYIFLWSICLVFNGKSFFFFIICKSEVIVFTSGCYNIDLPTPTRTQRQTRRHIPYLIISAFPLTELLVCVIGWRRLLLFRHYNFHEIVLHLNYSYQFHSQPLTALIFKYIEKLT